MRAFYGLACLLLMAAAAAPPAAARQRWYRGNTHAHTTNSDGDSSPYAVANWYRTNGYDFVFITDHDYLTDTAGLNALLGSQGRFLIIRGAEITDSFGQLPVHVNSLNPRYLTPHMKGGSVVETMLRNVNAVRAAGGLPYVAHPSWRNAMTAQHLKALPDYSLFELYNAGVTSYNYGDGTRPSVEQMWDEVLSTGKPLYGVAADDAHSLTDYNRAPPGLAWVMVRAAALKPDEIVRALARGDFYASNGAGILDLQVTNAGITVLTDESYQDCETSDDCLPQNSTVQFIGRNGRILKTTAENPAEYRFAGDELYVRARVTNPDGQMAWTQPVFLSGPAAAQTVLSAAIPDRAAPRSRDVAPGTLAVMLGSGFATVTAQAAPRPGLPYPPLELAGTRVTVGGRPAPLFFVSPTQVNFLIPADTPTGVSDVVITNPQGTESRVSLSVEEAAPALFTQDGTGAGEAVTYKLFREMPTIFTGDPRRVIVFATGVGRGGVTATANGQPVAVEAVAPNPSMPGLTQIHLALPAGLAPGPVTVVIRAGAAESNPVTVRL